MLFASFSRKRRYLQLVAQGRDSAKQSERFLLPFLGKEGR
jgi:hypothetical protein